MTDKEALLELLKRFEIVPEIGRFTPERLPHQPVDVELPPPLDEVSLVAKQGKVEGYHGFRTDFVFDLDGKFQGVGVWE